MKALARAPRGLNAEQLYYIIHPEIPFSQKPDADELKEIQNEFEMLGRLAIVKPRPEDRLGLQDEVYHIYAIVMDRTLDSRLGEMLERSSMYRILAAYAHYHKMIFREKRAAFFNEDQLSLDLRNPAEAPRLIMPSPNEFAQEDREQVYQSIDLWRKEELHYYLLRDLSDGMNTVAYEVMYNMNKAGHPDDFSDMEEIYQVLYYDDFLRFVDLPSYPAQLARGEAVIDVLRRFMRQLEVTRWLGRFVMRFDTERAETLYKQVDAYIATLPEKEQPSWKHTLSVADRMGWYEYLRIMSSPADIETALKNMEESARKLEELAHTRNDRVSSTGEKGFIGHPGLERIKRTLAFIYNTLGYGYANLGKERLAADRYARAVMLLRTTEDRFQMALVLNNLSRVLSDMGRERARRVCLDALELRKEEGFMVPVAYSTNTLALIDNDHMRPDLAWMEAAMAGAYFRQAGFMRGVGLALIQLGEALRRLAGSEKSLGRALPATPSAIFNASQTALDEAIQIFSMGKESKEVVRRIEAEIEMGCLQRDRLSTAEENIKNRLYKSALRHLDTATSLASQYGFARLRLDAEVNHAWTHYYMGDFARAEEKLAECEKVIPENARITLHHLPLPRDVDSYHFQQLSKMYGLRGRIEMDCYITRAREVEKKYIENMRSEERNRAIDADEIAQKFLKQAAEDYVLALGYAQLFSPRSGALQAIYDALYSRLKEFNAAKVESFYKYQNAQRKKYRLAKLRLEDLGDLGEFMRECIGAS